MFPEPQRAQASRAQASRKQRPTCKQPIFILKPNIMSTVQNVNSTQCQPYRLAQTYSNENNDTSVFHPDTHQITDWKHFLIIMFLLFTQYSWSSVDIVCAHILRCRAAELWGNESLWSGSVALFITHPAAPLHTRCREASTATVLMGNTMATSLTVRS